MLRSKPYRCVLSTALAIAAACAYAAAGDTPVAPAGESMRVEVVSVTGMAQKLVVSDGQKTWKPVRIGDKLGEQTVIRTGFRSRVVLKFADRGEVVVRNATKMGIGEFRNPGGKIRARLGLKYGVVRASVDSSRGPQDWKIKTPVSTLSIRGTSGEIGYGSDSGMGLHSTSGKWNIASGVRQRNIRPTEVIGTRSLSGGAGTLAQPIEVARLQRELTSVPLAQGLSRSEKKILKNQDSSNTLLGPVTGNLDRLRRRNAVIRLATIGAGMKD